ncbi:MAG TPA: GxxExxY protein [Anaerolineae bacterium]|nr:GxxExxY protein [Anaerolineae bacterium]HIP70934.1 GxxExxY protein [Anaerolineae bacterium]
MGDYLHSEITEKIIGAFYDVYNALGYGFLEKVYENALAIELRARGFAVTQQKHIHIHYCQQLIGEYLADMVVNDLILLELKAARAITPTHEAQLLNYLKATPYEVGLLFNFGPHPKHIRKVFSNHNKPNLPKHLTQKQ